jgi:TRAP-type mannitol/chloroaromatic compound transport system substrate-binding protein
MSGGRIEVEHFPAGLLPWGDEWRAAGEGTLDFIVDHCGGWHSGDDPGFAALHSLPGIWNGPRDARMWTLFFGGREIMNDFWESRWNMHYVWPAWSVPEPFYSRIPLTKLSDFEGLKLRSGAGLTQEHFTALGAAPVSVPGGEIYSALDTGLVEAAEYIGWTENWQNGMHEVTSYVLWPSFHSNTVGCDVSFNLEVWNSLPDDIQALVEAMAMEVGFLVDYMPSSSDFEFRKKTLEYGLTETQMPPEEFKKATILGVAVAKEAQTRSQFAHDMIQSVFDYKIQTGELTQDLIDAAQMP